VIVSVASGYNVKDGEGQVAVSQALSYEFGLSDERVARIMGTSKRTVFNYRHARRGSNVTSWENRSEENRKAAIARARRLMQGQ
jgi:predicted transcriptional regulator